MTKPDALNYYITTRALAAALCMSENTVSAWAEIPAIHQLRLESITDGHLRADDEAWAPASPRYSKEFYSNGRRKPYSVAATT